MANKYPVVTPELLDEIEALSPKEQGDFLFLEPHSKFPGRWYVDGINSAFFLDFQDDIGQYRVVSPAKLESFLAKANDLNYRVVFEEDPTEILSAWDHLNDPPAFSLNSEMPNTVAGMLPFQLQGFNYLRGTPKGGLAIWSTGTGKTALEAALIKQHLEIEDFDLALVVCKRNNKVDTQRKLLQLGSIDYAYIFDGTPKRRDQTYRLFEDALGGGPLVGICNYEKLRDDTDYFISMLEGRNVVIFWDEMPVKLSNRRTVLYDAVHEVLYDTGDSTVKWDKRRPKKLRQYDLSATPIENSPVGLLNQVRLIDPSVWPTISGWEKAYVASRDFFSKEPSTFRNLELMGLEVEHMTHLVDKEDPDIAKMFPKVREEVIYVDWSPQDRRAYDALQDIARELAKEAKKDESGEIKPLNPLQLIGILRMLCSSPSMVQASAENRAEFELALEEITDEAEADELSVSGSEAALLLLDKLKKPLTDKHCNKHEELRTLLQEKHPEEKFLVFTSFSGYGFPPLIECFNAWSVSYEVFKGTERERQEAKDRFRTDPDIRVLLLSDSGSDSIDVPEARIGVEYDPAWSHARKTQKRNRNHRVDSTHDWIMWYELVYPDSVEERMREIIARKKGYHDGVFKGSIGEKALSARMTRDDLLYILTGDSEFANLDE